MKNWAYKQYMKCLRTVHIGGWYINIPHYAKCTITDESKAITQIIEMVKEGTVTSVQRTKVALQAHSICVHGDGAHAVQFAKHARQEL